MKVMIMPNPNLKPLHRYERVVDKIDGHEISENDDTLTRAPNTKFTICANPSITLQGNLATGLLDEIDNPYADEPNYRTNEWEAILSGKEKILRQYVLEYKHGHPPEFYTNRVDPNSLRKGFKEHKDDIPYMQTSQAMINLNDGVTMLDLENPKDEVIYHICLANEMIANSYEELNHSTRFYMARAEEEGKRKASAKRETNKALAKLEDLSNKGEKVLADFCKVIGGELGKYRDLSESQAYNELDKFIKQKGEKLEQFNRIYSMFNKDKAEFHARVNLWNYTEYGIITKKGNTFEWIPPLNEDGTKMDKITWDRMSDVIEFLKTEKYQPEQELMEKQYRAKRRF